MKCPNCNEKKSKAIRTWKHLDTIKRVRRCQGCDFTWVTTEAIAEREE